MYSSHFKYDLSKVFISGTKYISCGINIVSQLGLVRLQNILTLYDRFVNKHISNMNVIHLFGNINFDHLFRLPKSVNNMFHKKDTQGPRGEFSSRNDYYRFIPENINYLHQLMTAQFNPDSLEEKYLNLSSQYKLDVSVFTGSGMDYPSKQQLGDLADKIKLVFGNLLSEGYTIHPTQGTLWTLNNI